MRRFEVTASTMGQSSPSYLGEGNHYKFKRDPDWTPNDPRYREVAPARQQAGAEARTARRGERIAEFAAALADLGVTDPANAPNPLVIEAGKRVGVQAKTAKSYRTALRQRQREEAQAS